MQKNFCRSYLVLFLIQLSTVSVTWAKSAILFIGDGMGPSIVSTTRAIKLGPDKKLFIETLPYTAMLKTYSADNYVTDSAASATSYSAGIKTTNGYLGMTPNQKAATLVTDLAKKKGLNVGLVTTTRITHATPAAFYAHINDREKEEDIAVQLLASKVDIALGGGAKGFKDEDLAKSKFKVLRTNSEMQAFAIGGKNLSQPLLGIFNLSHLKYMSERDPKNETEPTLSEMTEFALRFLRAKKKDFFLMVEGGRIDHAAHDNRIDDVLGETMEFDATISSAVKGSNPSSTLVLVTADHDTAGIDLSGYPTRPASTKELLDHVTFATGPKGFKKMDEAAHTGVDVELFAWGATAKNIHGVMENTAVFDILKRYLGL